MAIRSGTAGGYRPPGSLANVRCPCYLSAMTMPSPSPASGRFDRLSIIVLIAVGLVVAFAPGGDVLGEMGWDVRLLRILVGFLFLFQAVAIVEKNRIRRRVDDLFEGLNMLLYGKNYRSDREAIVILINAMKGKDEGVRTKAWENLKRLTGQEFAPDHQVWSAWWKANEKHFAANMKRPAGGEEKE